MADRTLCAVTMPYPAEIRYEAKRSLFAEHMLKRNAPNGRRSSSTSMTKSETGVTGLTVLVPSIEPYYSGYDSSCFETNTRWK